MFSTPGEASGKSPHHHHLRLLKADIRNLTLSILWRSRRPPIVDTPSDAGGRSDRLIPTVQVMCQYAAIGITQYATRVFVAIDGQ